MARVGGVRHASHTILVQAKPQRGTCPPAHRCGRYEPTESPRSPETARARLNSCRAYVAARGARSQVISVGRSWWRNRLHGAYRGARKVAGGGVCVHVDAFFTPASGARRRGAPESRRLAGFGTERPGLSQKFRSYRRDCAHRGKVEKPQDQPWIMALDRGS